MAFDKSKGKAPEIGEKESLSPVASVEEKLRKNIMQTSLNSKFNDDHDYLRVKANSIFPALVKTRASLLLMGLKNPSKLSVGHEASTKKIEDKVEESSQSQAFKSFHQEFREDIVTRKLEKLKTKEPREPKKPKESEESKDLEEYDEPDESEDHEEPQEIFKNGSNFDLADGSYSEFSSSSSNFIEEQSKKDESLQKSASKKKLQKEFKRLVELNNLRKASSKKTTPPVSKEIEQTKELSEIAKACPVNKRENSKKIKSSELSDKTNEQITQKISKSKIPETTFSTFDRIWKEYNSTVQETSKKEAKAQAQITNSFKRLSEPVVQKEAVTLDSTEIELLCNELRLNNLLETHVLPMKHPLKSSLFESDEVKEENKNQCNRFSPIDQYVKENFPKNALKILKEIELLKPRKQSSSKTDTSLVNLSPKKPPVAKAVKKEPKYAREKVTIFPERLKKTQVLKKKPDHLTKPAFPASLSNDSKFEEHLVILSQELKNLQNVGSRIANKIHLPYFKTDKTVANRLSSTERQHFDPNMPLIGKDGKVSVRFPMRRTSVDSMLRSWNVVDNHQENRDKDQNKYKKSMYSKVAVPLIPTETPTVEKISPKPDDLKKKTPFRRSKILEEYKKTTPRWRY